MSPSVPDHKRDTTIWPSATSALRESARLFSWQNKPTRPATNPPQPPRCNGQRRRVYFALRSLAFRSTSLTWRKKHEHCRQSTHYARSRTGTDSVGVRRRGSHFGAAIRVCFLVNSGLALSSEKFPLLLEYHRTAGNHWVQTERNSFCSHRISPSTPKAGIFL